MLKYKMNFMVFWTIFPTFAAHIMCTNKKSAIDMNKKIIYIASCAGVVLLGIIVWLALSLKSQKEDLEFFTEQYALEKDELETEYNSLAIEYEGYKLKVNNDSLEQKLEDQRIKIQQLVEELKQTKKEDARKIASLKKELETVRGVLRYYVAQVDSLNQVNEALQAENTQVKKDLRRANEEKNQISRQNEQLNKIVDIASHLNAQNIQVTARNKRQKKTSSLKNTTTFEVSFTIAANVTAETGEKQVYVRILRPNEELLTNSKSGTFSYDGSTIEFSMKKTIEYAGEELPVTLYWNRNETLDPGTYRFEIFADGKSIGRSSLVMEK